jgi:site-specific DNA-methyltransferase (cytosine-N4-specific)
LTGDAETVLDPFCGSGTTLLEAARAGSAVLGFDCNPIAVLITRFKLLEATRPFFARCEARLRDADERAETLALTSAELHDFAGRDHWFDPVVQRELAALLDWIRSEDDGDVRTWLECSLSAIINRVSFQDSETRYVRTDRAIQVGATVNSFIRKATELLQALDSRGPLPGQPRSVEVADVLDGLPVADSTIDLIVTSPPYANTMDYYLYHKQRMNVLGFDFKVAQEREIGSRWEYSSLKATRQKWDSDYTRSLAEIRRLLKPGGRAVIIIGDSQIAGELVDAAAATVAAAAAVGLEASVLESVPLSGRSRSFSGAFQRPNKNEHVIELLRSDSSDTYDRLKDCSRTHVPEEQLLRAAPITARHYA